MRTKPEIIQLLRLSEMEYANQVEQLGLKFLAYYCRQCPGAERYLAATAAFWKWWKRHFDVRDEIFLADFGTYTQKQLVDQLRTYWMDSHAPESIEGRIPGPAWRQMTEAMRQRELPVNNIFIYNKTTLQ